MVCGGRKRLLRPVGVSTLQKLPRDEHQYFRRVSEEGAIAQHRFLGFRGPRKLHERLREAEIARAILRGDLREPRELLPRFVERGACKEQPAQVQARLGKIRCNGECIAIVAFCIRELAATLGENAEAVMRRR